MEPGVASAGTLGTAFDWVSRFTPHPVVPNQSLATTEACPERNGASGLTGDDPQCTQGFPKVFLPIAVQSGRYSSSGAAFACAISRYRRYSGNRSAGNSSAPSNLPSGV